MQKIELKQINGNIIDLLEGLTEEEKTKVINHVESNNSCAKIILNQINNSNLYDFLKGKTFDNVYDFGGNIGLFSLFIQPICKRLYTIEPTPSHLELLRILTNRFDNIWIIPGAINTYSGKTKFYTEDTNSTMNSLLQRNGESIEVDCFSLNDLLTLGDSTDFLKIDIEGFENELIKNEEFKNTLNKVKSFFIEVHGDLENNRNVWIDSMQNFNSQKIGPDGAYLWKK